MRYLPEWRWRRKRGPGMKKLAIIMTAVVALAISVPSWSEPVTDGCSATTGATASALVPESAPACDFVVICDASFCVWNVDLNANGTGLVSGTMTAEILFFPGGGTVNFVN